MKGIAAAITDQQSLSKLKGDTETEEKMVTMAKRLTRKVQESVIATGEGHRRGTD